MYDIEDAYALDVAEPVALAVYNYLENGRIPAGVQRRTEGPYIDRVLLTLNDIMGGEGIGEISVNGEVLARYVKKPGVTVVYDERSGGYWSMQPQDWRPF